MNARLVHATAALAALLAGGCILDLADLSGGGGTTGGSTGTGGSARTGGAGTGGGQVTAAQLQALAANCTRYPGSTNFAPYPNAPDTIPVCSLKGAVWWTAGMSIACDGGSGAPCKSAPGYSPGTAGTDSLGNPLDASTLPFVVVPQASNGFDFMAAGLTYGSVVAVLYEDRLVYAILGDEGARGILGEGSYALALALGIDPNPATGGVATGVTYLAFTGAGADVLENEDAAEARQLGAQLAATLVASN